MHWLTTVEAHVVILATVIADTVTTVVGLRALRRKLNNHVEQDDQSYPDLRDW